MAKKLIAIVGPTASGKSRLAMELARIWRGQIICADSRTVFRGMDIGTAKPSESDQLETKHHCLDLVDPDQEYNVAQFQADAKQAIDQIKSDGELPILAGGSGLYINAVLYDYQFPGSPSERHELDSKPIAELVSELEQLDPESAQRVDLANRRRVIRAIETSGQRGQRRPNLQDGYRVIGLNPGKEQLQKNIAVRTAQMLKAGLVAEAKQISQRFGRTIESLNTVGYIEALKYLDGKLSLAQLEREINTKSWQLARRQMTWFKRDPNIVWYDNLETALAQLVKNGT